MLSIESICIVDRDIELYAYYMCLLVQAYIGGPVSDPVMQVTLSNSGANMIAKPSGITHSHVHSAICLHSYNMPVQCNMPV